MSTEFPIEDEPVDPGGPPPPTPTPTPSPTPAPTPTPVPTPTPSPTGPADPLSVIPAYAQLPLVGLRTLRIPLSAVPSQILAITLGQQPCTIRVYAKAFGLYLDLYVAGAPIVLGVLAHDRNRIVRDAYHDFIGDLTFVDTQGRDDPTYDALDTRFVLLWLSG